MARGVRKTTLDLNVELLERAQEILGTHGIKDTIDRALEEVVAAEARRWNIEYLRNLDPIDPNELRQQAWGR
jgi:Arc/MetJ family transcription regulator